MTIKELRLEGIKSTEEVNHFLEKHLKKNNQRFAVQPLISDDAHKAKGKEVDLKQIFSKREHRTLSKTNGGSMQVSGCTDGGYIGIKCPKADILTLL